MISFPESRRLLQRAQKIIPGYSQTFSKGPQVYGFHGVPHYLRRADGVMAEDVDGNQFIDYSMGLGSVLLGHAFPLVSAAVAEQANNGSSLSLMHSLEIEVAEQILNLCPWADMVRFGKNGSDVVTAAVRVARASTGRDLILMATDYGIGSVEAYHGWHDWSAGHSSMDRGVPEAVKRLTVLFTFNSVASLETAFQEHYKRVAAVVLEGAKLTSPSVEFVDALNTLPRQNGALLVLDEVANGLRLAPGGAHERFDIRPDLVTYGKSFGNGVPISIIVGKLEFMQLFSEVLFTLTYGGELLGLAAARTVLGFYHDEPVWERVTATGETLFNEITAIIRAHGLSDRVLVRGYPQRFAVVPVTSSGRVDSVRQQQLRQLLFSNGILCAGIHNISYSLRRSHVSRTLEAYDAVFKTLY